MLFHLNIGATLLLLLLLVFVLFLECFVFDFIDNDTLLFRSVLDVIGFDVSNQVLLFRYG